MYYLQSFTTYKADMECNKDSEIINKTAEL